ncbi:MAG: HNH endonuclease [Phototrophicaceae bacterium]|jgi:5-methylcytosine-specific restriction endonuclease McrA
MTSYIPEAIRSAVTARAQGKCEYCLLHQRYGASPHEIDHIIPEKHRGETQIDNLCLACFECNRYKGTSFASFDPQTQAIIPLFNPRQQSWSDHFYLKGGEIIPTTSIGEVTEFVLRLNDEERLETRKLLLLTGFYP